MSDTLYSRKKTIDAFAAGNVQRSKAIVIISWTIFILAVVLMVSWISDAPIRQTIFWRFLGVKFNSSLCLALTSMTLLATQYPAFRYRKAILLVFPATALLIALLSLAEYVFGVSTGIDQFFVKEVQIFNKAYPVKGRMAFNASLELIFLSLGLVILRLTGNKTLKICAQCLFHAVTIVAGIGIIGYVYHVSLYHSLLSTPAMDLHTCTIFILLSFAALMLNPSMGIVRLFVGSQIGDKVGRRLFLIIAALVIIYGAARLQLQRSGAVSMETSVAIMIVAFLAAVLTILWFIGRWMNRSDTLRTKAEEEVKAMNADLERRVEERSREIVKTETKYRSLIEHASDAIYIADFKGRFRDVNNKTCQMLGYSREELLQMRVDDIVDAEELKTAPVLYTLGGAESMKRERTLKRKDGSIFSVEINANLFAEETVLVIARDITEWKQILKNLQEAEEKFRTLAERSMVGIYIYRAPYFLYINPRFAEIFGFETSELMGVDARPMIIHPDYLGLVEENISGRMENDAASADYEVKGLRKDGSTNWVRFFGSSVKIDGQPALIGTALDITDSKQVVNDLQEAELKFRLLAEKSMVGVYITQNKRFLYANDRFAEIFGYERQELMNLADGVIDKIYAAESRAMIREKIRARDSGETEGAHYEAVGLRKDGTRNQVEFYGTRVAINGQPATIGTALDITERKIAEQQLMASEERYKLLFYSNPLPKFIYDFDTLRIVDVNNVAQKVYGYSRQEFLAMTVNDLRTEQNPSVRSILDQVKTNNEIMHVGIFNHVRKDGSVMKMDISGYRFDYMGKLCIMVVCNDVTEKELAMEQLKQLNESLQKQAKELSISNSELEQFAYVASHDLQEPLRMITSFLDRLELKYADLVDDRGKQYIHFATDGAKRMRELILDLLAFSRVGRADVIKESVNVNRLLDEGLKLFKVHAAELGGNISYGRLPVLYAYRTLLMQVFQNLIGNSLKYRKADTAPLIEITYKENPAEFEFAVKDNGIGISSEYFDKIFIVFQRLHNKDEYSGTGMGLAITKKIVENMGGEIWVTSEEDKGSTFYFTIPKKV